MRSDRKQKPDKPDAKQSANVALNAFNLLTLLVVQMTIHVVLRNRSEEMVSRWTLFEIVCFVGRFRCVFFALECSKLEISKYINPPASSIHSIYFYFCRQNTMLAQETILRLIFAI